MTTRESGRELGVRGAAFWRRTIEGYELSDGELEILGEICRTLDLLDRLAEAVEVDGTMITGAAGQAKLHPALAEARGQRIALHRLLAALALPDDHGDAVPSPASIRGSKAAAARWAPHRAAQAAREGAS